jgi:hypothetical protein
MFSLAQPTLALSVTDFFSFKYTAAFSTPGVPENSTFSVTITGTAVCIKDLTAPFNMVSEAKITGGIAAVNQSTGASIPLNSSFLLDIKPFPKKSGESAQASQTLDLQFPPGSPPGRYTLEGRLTEAKVLAVFWLTITQYLPASISLGTVSYGPTADASPSPSPEPSTTPSPVPSSIPTPEPPTTPAPVPSAIPAPAAPPSSASSPYPGPPVEITPRKIEVPPAPASAPAIISTASLPAAAPTPTAKSAASLPSAAPPSPSPSPVSGLDPHPLNWQLIGGISIVVIMLLIVSFWVRKRRAG